MDHMVWINAERFTPVKDEKAIPNGIIQPVKRNADGFYGDKRDRGQYGHGV